MKLILFFTLFFFIISCRTISYNKRILGNWKIISWVDHRTNENLTDNQNETLYNIKFIPDTVFVDEGDSSEIHHFRFKWSIQNDTLLISSIGMFKIVSLNRRKCVLDLSTRPFFSANIEKEEWHKETLTLKINKHLMIDTKLQPH